MSEMEPAPAKLNLRSLRERALRTRAEMADDLGVSAQLLVNLELGHSDTRLLLIFQLCVLLARYLGQRPSQVWAELLPPEMYDSFEDVREYAVLRLASLETQKGNYRAKRGFIIRSEATTKPNALPKSINFYRFQLLFAKSNYSQVELSLITGISERRLNYLFAISAEKTGQLSLRIFLRLAAALAPVYEASVREPALYEASVRETALYLVEKDLQSLDAYVLSRRPSADSKSQKKG